jgi:Flp pilus assembly protein TadG
MKPRLAGNRRGSGIVETALVLSSFLFMLIAILDFGQFLFIHQTLVERARTAVRYAAVNRTATTSQIQNLVLFNQTTAPSGRTTGDFGVTTAMVTVSDVTLDAAGKTSQSPARRVTIRNYPFTMFTPIIGGGYTGRAIVASLPREF